MATTEGIWKIKIGPYGHSVELEHNGEPVEHVTGMRVEARAGELTRATVYLELDLVDVDVEGSLDEVEMRKPVADYAEEDVLAWADRHGMALSSLGVLKNLAARAGVEIETGDRPGEWTFTDPLDEEEIGVLSLNLRVGESVSIDGVGTMKLRSCKRKEALLIIVSGPVSYGFAVGLGQWVEITEDIAMTLSERNTSTKRASLVFRAPKSVKILRGELGDQ